MDNLIAMFQDTSLSSLNLVIFAFFIGACLAGAATVFHRRTTGALVRYLLEEQAFSPESAKTLRDAELELSPFVRWSVSHNAAFQRVVTMAETEKDPKTGKKPSLSDTPLYIAPEARLRAEEMYGGKHASDGNMWLVLLGIAVFGVIAYLSTYIIPYLVNMVNSLIVTIKS